MDIVTKRCTYYAQVKPWGNGFTSTIKNFSTFFLLLFLSSSSIFGQHISKTAKSLPPGINSAWAVNTPSKNSIKLDYQTYSNQGGIIYKESAVSVTAADLPLLAGAATPCTAHRWFAGDGWRQNTADNTVVNKWEAIVQSSPNLQPKGIVRCASSAETESGLEAFKGTYDIASNPISAVLPKTDCFSMNTGTFGNTVTAPTQGEEIVWLNFDIRPFAGTYQFQIVTNENVGFVLFYVDPADAKPIDGVTTGTTYPVPNDGISGNCNNLKFSTIDIGGVAHPACGLSGNGWTTITVPSFKKPTNYYLAMWMADPAVTAFPNSMNLIYKSRYGCGGSTCTLQNQAKKVTCNNNGTYSVCLNYGGSAGRWAIKDETGLATNLSYTTYLQDGTTVVTSGTTPMTLGTIPDGAVLGTICATYPLGTGYDISLTPDPTYKPSSDYIQCADGDRQTGSSAVAATLAVDVSPHCSTPVTGEGCINISSAAHNAQLSVTSALPGGISAFTYKWEIVGGSTGVLTNSTLATATYTAGALDQGLDVNFKVTATPKDASVCAQTATVVVHVSSIGRCGVTGLTPVCIGSTNTYTGAPSIVPTNATYTWALSGFGGSGTTDATLASANGLGTIDVKSVTQGYRITLNQAYANTDLNASCYEDVTISSVTANAGTPFTKTCIANISGGTIGEAAAVGFTYSWTSVPAGFTSTSANPSVNPSVTTSYTVRKTNTASGCYGDASVTVTVNNGAVIVNAGDDFTITCIANVNGKQIGEAAEAGYTYSWSPATGLNAANISNPTANPAVTTTYTVTKTNTATGCSNTDQVTVTVNNAAITVCAVAADVKCNGGADGSVMLTFSGGTATYMVNFNGGGFVIQTSPKSYIGLAAATYTWVVKDANGCQQSGSVSVGQPAVLSCNLNSPASLANCSTTGNIITGSVTGGTAPYTCSASFDATGTGAGWIVTNCGVTGSGTTVTYTSGTTVSTVLTVTITDAHGCKTSCTVTLTCNGGIAQACTPGFWKNHAEVWDTPTDFVVNNMPGVLTTPVIPGGTFVTTTNFWAYFKIPVGTDNISQNANLTMIQALALGGGNCIALTRHGVSALLGASAFPTHYPFPAGTTNFGNLYTLIRNAFLSGNCSDLATTLANINQLDGDFCGALSKLPQCLQAPSSTSAKMLTVTDLYVKAYPNPYASEVNFNFISPVSGKVNLEIYDITGRRLAIVYSGWMDANVARIAKYHVPATQKSPLVYKLTTGGKTVVGKLLPGDRNVNY